MAHFAKLDKNNKVINVIRVGNEHMLDENGVEKEELGLAYIRKVTPPFESEVKWVQTSFNENFRKEFASIDFTYDEVNDVFIRPQPHASWTLNPETFDWEPPVPRPDPTGEENTGWVWDESKLKWVFVRIDI
jgi:hypothetical protein